MPALNPQPDARPVSRILLRSQLAWRRFAAAVSGLDARRMPHFAGVAFAVLGSATAYGVSLGGHSVVVLDAFAEPLGLTIETVDVTGQSETSEIDVLQTLWATGSQTLASLDVAAARDAIAQMPWIQSASVSKIFPDRVRIDLVEKEPFAIWQKGRDLTIVDREGRAIVPWSTTRFTDLPFVVGTGAETTAAEFVDRMQLVPELRDRVKAYIRVGERRWDLRLDNGVTIRLPEREPIEAAAEVLRMDHDSGLLSRDIQSVDMRLEDRVVVKLTAEAKIRREAALKARAKLLKQSQREKGA